jgi:hypothetical protein
MADLSWDICENNHGGVKESVAAHESIAGSKVVMQGKILAWLHDVGSGTCDAAELALGMSHQSCSARFSELSASGEIEDTGRRLPTRSGRSARVYRIPEELTESDLKEYYGDIKYHVDTE